MMVRRFPPPWSVDEQSACFVVRDQNGQALAYVYFEDRSHPVTLTGPSSRHLNLVKTPSKSKNAPLSHQLGSGRARGGLPSGRHGDTDLHGVEKHRMRAEFADDYDVRISRRVACIGIWRVRRNVDEMPGSLPVCCFADRTYYRIIIFPMLAPPALDQVVVCFG